tara:strand:- start:187 stop:528 length:342 start_codon:yes stop_codon:yes gene_type:complete|eukprot:scaffold20611_cov56-Phaeocystis_antarctica.AAC.1
MRAADVLATAASTFSFTAAMLAHEIAHEIAPPPPPPPPPSPSPSPSPTPSPSSALLGGGAPPARFWRPDPTAGALVAFDPWAAPVLLNACHSGTHFRREAHSAGGGGVGGGGS